MKLTYELSNLAEQDLENIWVYTFNNWSRNQANKYYKLLMNEIANICKAKYWPTNSNINNATQDLAR